MSRPGIVEAPAAMDLCRPEITQRFLTSSYKGSEGRILGVDFIGTIGSSNSAYSITSYVLNARNSTTFPRLSAIASVFRRFYFRKLRFHLFGIQGSTQSGYAAMTSIITDDLGTLATPTTEAQILNSESVALCRPWSFTTHDVMLEGQGLAWYATDTSASSTEFGEAPGLAYLGISQTTNANDIQIQLYVEYECEVCMRSAATLVAGLALFGGLVAGGGSIAAANLLGNSPTADADAVGIIVGSGVILFRQSQTAVMSVNVTGTALTAINTPSGWTLLSATTSSTSASAVFAKVVTASESSGVLTMASGTPTATSVVVSAVPPSSLTYSSPYPILRPLHEPRMKYIV